MALTSHYLTVVRCVFTYVGYYFKCALKSQREIRRDNLRYIGEILESDTPEYEMTHEPIDKEDAAAGISYSMALLKAMRLQENSVSKEYYIVIGKNAEKAKSVATVRGQPIFYILNDVLKKSGCELSAVGNMFGSKDLFICSITQI